MGKTRGRHQKNTWCRCWWPTRTDGKQPMAFLDQLVPRSRRERYEKVVNWDDSEGREALKDAKFLSFAKLIGISSSDLTLPDPNMYIDTVDHNSVIDPELLKGLGSISDDEREGEAEVNCNLNSQAEINCNLNSQAEINCNLESFLLAQKFVPDSRCCVEDNKEIISAINCNLESQEEMNCDLLSFLLAKFPDRSVEYDIENMFTIGLADIKNRLPSNI